MKYFLQCYALFYGVSDVTEMNLRYSILSFVSCRNSDHLVDNFRKKVSRRVELTKNALNSKP